MGQLVAAARENMNTQNTQPWVEQLLTHLIVARFSGVSHLVPVQAPGHTAGTIGLFSVRTLMGPQQAI